MPVQRDRTLGECLREFRERLVPLHGEAEAKAMARETFRDALGTDPLLCDARTVPSTDQVERARSILDRLLTGMPFQYALGHAWFMGLRIAVDPRVLIPRPETEELVHTIIAGRSEPPAHIVDLCTGSGCIALALKKAFPTAEVQGVDISPGALEVVRANAVANALEVVPLQLDALRTEELTERLRDRSPGKTIIVSNPPYVPVSDRASMEPHVLRHEPHLALFVEDHDPLVFYRSIATASARALSPGDELWFETHHLHAQATAEVVRASGFKDVRTFRDLSGNERTIRARW